MKAIASFRPAAILAMTAITRASSTSEAYTYGSTGSASAPAPLRNFRSRSFALPGYSCTPTRRPARSCRSSVVTMPSVVGSSAGTSAANPISRSARTGFGPRVILRARRSAAMKADSRLMRRAKPRSAVDLHLSSARDRHTSRPRSGATTPLQVLYQAHRGWRSLDKEQYRHRALPACAPVDQVRAFPAPRFAVRSALPSCPNFHSMPIRDRNKKLSRLRRHQVTQLKLSSLDGGYGEPAHR